MLTLVSCPTCHHKFTIPEASMGERRTCPNCQSIFLAGKSTAESEGKGAAKSMLSAGMPGPRVAMDKTMLGETEAAPIKYNCPRCKKPLEAPASEAGIKKPCPACGGRLQVPALPKPPAGDPSLNKTLLADVDGQYAASAPPPRPAAPLPAAAAPIPSVAAAPVPANAAPPGKFAWVTKKHWIAAGIAAAVLLALLIPGKTVDPEKENFKKELERLNAEIKQKEALFAQQQMLMDKQKQEFEAKQKQIIDDVNKERERQREYELKVAQLKDQQLQAQERAKLDLDQKRAKEDFDRKQQDLEAQRAAADRALQQKMADLQQQLNQANQQRAQTTTVIQQPAPPPYYPGFYRPWWW